jgi:hypothetical protein
MPGKLGCAMPQPRQLAALRLTPFRNATVDSLLSAAFSSLRLVVSSRTTSVMAELIRPGNQGAISRDLIMLDRLGGADHRGIKDLLVLHFARYFVCFRN